MEYKHGARNKAPWIAACDDLQLAAQAICLEEMTGKWVPAGALFYAKSKRRREVLVEARQLRGRVAEAAAAVRAMLDAAVLPAPTLRPALRQMLARRCQPGDVAACSRTVIARPDAMQLLNTLYVTIPKATCIWTTTPFAHRGRTSNPLACAPASPFGRGLLRPCDDLAQA